MLGRHKKKAGLPYRPGTPIDLTRDLLVMTVTGRYWEPIEDAYPELATVPLEQRDWRSLQAVTIHPPREVSADTLQAIIGSVDNTRTIFAVRGKISEKLSAVICLMLELKIGHSITIYRLRHD